jgi:hypothetical protein
MMSQLPEIFFPQTKQRGAIEFRVTTNKVVCMRMQRLTILVVPRFFRDVLAVEIYRSGTPVVFFARHVIATFEQQDFLSRWRELISKGASARTSADDDYVVVVVVRHGCAHASVMLFDEKLARNQD